MVFVSQTLTNRRVSLRGRIFLSLRIDMEYREVGGRHMQSDFQRTFMLLRPLDAKDSATSGFCRMERRGNRGKLAFTVQGVQRQGTLHPVLITGDGGEAKVVPCGELRIDARGHGNLTYPIDSLTPSVAAQYRAVGIAEVAQGELDLVMVGFFGKGRPFDKAAVERVAARTLGLSVAEAVLEPATPPPGKRTPPFAKPAVQQEAPPLAQQPPSQEAAQRAAPTQEAAPMQEQQAPESLLPSNVWSQPAPEPGTTPALGLPEELADAIWPDSAAALRELFERFEVVAPVTGAENELFVSIPMNGGMMGIDHYLLGVRLDNGYVTAIGYGIPGKASAPPAGLAGYAWMDTPLGGYWLKWEELR
jgi:hypothetical protein